jgi:hypothetical protein
MVCGDRSVTCRQTAVRRRWPRTSFASGKELVQQISPEPYAIPSKGSVVVIDGGEDGDTGTIGSATSWAGRFGARWSRHQRWRPDTDEIIKEKVPLYYKRPARAFAQAEWRESMNNPRCAGAVRPGDVVARRRRRGCSPREQAAEAPSTRTSSWT